MALLWALPSALQPTPFGLRHIAISVFGLTTNILAGQIGAVLAMIDRFGEPVEQADGGSGLPRFSIRTLLAVMVPICVVLTLFRYLGLLRLETLVICLAWLLLQHLLRRPAVRLTLWWLDRKAKKDEQVLRPDLGMSESAQ